MNRVMKRGKAPKARPINLRPALVSLFTEDMSVEQKLAVLDEAVLTLQVHLVESDQRYRERMQQILELLDSRVVLGQLLRRQVLGDQDCPIGIETPVKCVVGSICKFWSERAGCCIWAPAPERKFRRVR